MLQKLTDSKLEEVSRHLKSSSENRSEMGTFMVPSPEGDSEELLSLAFLIDFEEESVVCNVLGVYCVQ